MRVVSNAVSQAFAQSLSNHGVTVAEWVVLREMFDADGKTSPSTVAELTGLTRGAVSKLVTRLLNKHLVARSESTGDRRYQDIKLTAKARQLVPSLARVADKNDETFFSVLSAQEHKQLMATLVKLAEFHELSAAPIE